jgi:hypothetical protein
MVGSAAGTHRRVSATDHIFAVVVRAGPIHSSAWSRRCRAPKGAPVPLTNGARTRQNALLAQSVEHSHGKAGVVGSIPTEGSTKWSGNRPATSQTPGGVAQLVRASGS